MKRSITINPAAQQYLDALTNTLGKPPTAETYARALERGLHVVLSSEQARLKEQLMALPTALDVPTAPTKRLALVDDELALCTEWTDY